MQGNWVKACNSPIFSDWSRKELMKKIHWSLLSVLLYAIIFIARRRRESHGGKLPKLKATILRRSKSKCPACKGFGVVRAGLLPIDGFDFDYRGNPHVRPPGQTHTTCPICKGFGLAGNDLLKARADASDTKSSIPNCPCQLKTVSPCEACHAAGEWQCYTGLCQRCTAGRAYDETETRRHGEPMPKPESELTELLTVEAELEEANDSLQDARASVAELRGAMNDYQMDVEEDPPFKHREMMKRADAVLEEPDELSQTVDLEDKVLHIECVECGRVSKLSSYDLKTILLFLSGSPIQVQALKSLVGGSWDVKVGHDLKGYPGRVK